MWNIWSDINLKPRIIKTFDPVLKRHIILEAPPKFIAKGIYSIEEPIKGLVWYVPQDIKEIEKYDGLDNFLEAISKELVNFVKEYNPDINSQIFIVKKPITLVFNLFEIYSDQLVKRVVHKVTFMINRDLKK